MKTKGKENEIKSKKEKKINHKKKFCCLVPVKKVVKELQPKGGILQKRSREGLKSPPL